MSMLYKTNIFSENLKVKYGQNKTLNVMHRLTCLCPVDLKQALAGICRYIVKYINKNICTIIDARSYMNTIFYCLFFSVITPTIAKTILILSLCSYSLMLRSVLNIYLKCFLKSGLLQQTRISIAMPIATDNATLHK